MRNATNPRFRVPLRLKPVDWQVTTPTGSVHTVTSFYKMHLWFASHPETDIVTCTIHRNGSLIQQGLYLP